MGMVNNIGFSADMYTYTYTYILYTYTYILLNTARFKIYLNNMIFRVYSKLILYVPLKNNSCFVANTLINQSVSAMKLKAVPNSIFNCKRTESYQTLIHSIRWSIYRQKIVEFLNCQFDTAHEKCGTGNPDVFSREDCSE